MERHGQTRPTVVLVNCVIIFLRIDDIRCGKGSGSIGLACGGFTIRLEARVSNDHVASIVFHSATQLLVPPSQDHQIGITVNEIVSFVV